MTRATIRAPYGDHHASNESPLVITASVVTLTQDPQLAASALTVAACDRVWNQSMEQYGLVFYTRVQQDMGGAKKAADKAPESLLAVRRDPTAPRSRPLCPHPQVAKDNGNRSTDDAANFTCSTGF